MIGSKDNFQESEGHGSLNFLCGYQSQKINVGPKNGCYGLLIQK